MTWSHEIGVVTAGLRGNDDAATASGLRHTAPGV